MSWGLRWVGWVGIRLLWRVEGGKERSAYVVLFSPDIVVTSTKKKSGHLYHKDAARKVKSAARKALALRALQEGETTDASPGTRGMRPAYFALGEKLGTQVRTGCYCFHLSVVFF